MIRRKATVAEEIMAVLRANGCDVNEYDLLGAIFKFLDKCDELEAKSKESKE